MKPGDDLKSLRRKGQIIICPELCGDGYNSEVIHTKTCAIR